MSSYQYAGNNPIAGNDPMGNKIRAVPPPCNCGTALSGWIGGSGGGGGGNGDFLAALDEQASWGLYGLDPSWATEQAYNAVSTSGISQTNNHDGTWTIVDNTGSETSTSIVNDDGSPGGKTYYFVDGVPTDNNGYANGEYTNTYTNWTGTALYHWCTLGMSCASPAGRYPSIPPAEIRH